MCVDPTNCGGQCSECLVAEPANAPLLAHMRCVGCGDYEDERPASHNAPCSNGNNESCHFIPVDADGKFTVGHYAIDCNHCGGHAISNSTDRFVDGEGERCNDCGFPGHVSIDDDEEGDGN